VAVTVRRARYESEREELVELLQAHLPYRAHARFFDWLYRRNPDGEALAWVATDGATQRIVGAATAFPRGVFFAGRKARGYVLGDFCIDPAHRSLGLALALQRACLEGLSAEDADFAFDFPSNSMVAVYNRLRIGINERLVRHVKLLRADLAIGRRVPSHAATRVLSGIANSALRARDFFARRNGGWKISCEPGRCADEFAVAARRWIPGAAVTVARTAEYLNWRYESHPQHSYEIISARKDGKLGGYVVRHEADNGFVIDDLLAEGSAAYGALLSNTIETGRARDLYSIVAPWPANDPGRRLLEAFGFRPRSSSPAVLLGLSKRREENGVRRLFHADWEF
jgi:hypothetical protein